MSSGPEPHRDQRTIGSFKRTLNAALLMWVDGRRREHAPQQTLRPARLLLWAGGAAVVLGLDPSTLLSLGSSIGL